MKLKDTFLTQKINDTQYLVPVGAEDFTGIVRNNGTAAFIVEQLREETDMARIVDAMCLKYDAPREKIEADVGMVLEKLRDIHAIEE